MGQVDHLVNWLETRADWLGDYFNGRMPGHDPMGALVDYFAREGRINVTLDGRRHSFDTPPIMLHNTVMLSLDELAPMLGLTVDYSPETGAIEMRKGSSVLTHTAGGTAFIAGTESTDRNIPSFVIRGQVFLPVRIVAQTFGYSVDWQGSTVTVILRSGG